MKAGDLVRVDYGESGFGPLCIFLGYSKCTAFIKYSHSSEWMNLLDPTGKKVEVHVDYVYPARKKIHENR